MWLLATLLTTGVALSRIYLGVHFPTDVVGGAILGVLLLAVWYAYGGRTESWFRELNLSRQLMLAGIAPLTAIAVFPGEDVVTAGGTFLGLATGIILERHRLRFSTNGSISARIMRFLVGGVVLVGIWWGLRRLFDGAEPALLLRLVRYALVGFWGTFGAPWLFLRVGLARAKP